MIASTVAPYACCAATEMRRGKIFSTNCQPNDISIYRITLQRATSAPSAHGAVTGCDTTAREARPAPLVGWPARHRRCRIAHAIAKKTKSATQAPYPEGMSGLHVGSARGFAALRWRPRADRGVIRRERGRIVLDHRTERRRQDLDRQLHFGPLQADRRPALLSRQGRHRAQSERAASARHRPHLPE